MALNHDDLLAIAALLDAKLDAKLEPVNARLDRIESTVFEIKDTVDKNYNMLEEFYVNQKEYNTITADRLAII